MSKSCTESIDGKVKAIILTKQKHLKLQMLYSTFFPIKIVWIIRKQHLYRKVKLDFQLKEYLSILDY